MGKITTVEIDDDVLSYIDVTIKRGKFRHLKEFVNHCLKLASIYTMDEWDTGKGTFYIYPCRVALLPTDALSMLMGLIPEEHRRKAVEDITSCLRPRIRFFNLSPKNPEHFNKIIELLTLHGLGKFSHEKGIIEVSYPVLSVDATKEMLEALLEVKLEVMEASKVIYMFKVLA